MSSEPEYRASVDDVRQYLHVTDWDPAGLDDSFIERYIDDANLLVDEELEETDQSERRLAKLEALIAGHYLLSSGIDDLRQTERDGSADGSYSWYAGGPDESMAFEETSLGRRAIAEDRSDTLKNLHRETASIDVPRVK